MNEWFKKADLDGKRTISYEEIAQFVEKYFLKSTSTKKKKKTDSIAKASFDIKQPHKKLQTMKPAKMPTVPTDRDDELGESPSKTKIFAVEVPMTRSNTVSQEENFRSTLHASGDEAVHIQKQTKIIAAPEPTSGQHVIQGAERPVALHERAPELDQQHQADASPSTRQDEETPGKLI